MSWESSKVYYELLNKLAKEKLGGFHSCKCIMYSVDFAEVEALQMAENWDALDSMMAEAAIMLETAGADLVVLCTNTMHLCNDAIINSINIPFLHIADATGEVIQSKGLKKIGLLGTKFTMEKDFYKSTLKKKFGLDTIIPSPADMEIVHNIIYQELVKGEIKSDSGEKVISIIKKLKNSGAEGVILGCTELPLLITENDVSIPIFDTTKIHAEKAMAWAINIP